MLRDSFRTGLYCALGALAAVLVAGTASAQTGVSIRCAWNTPTGIQLAFDVPDMVPITDLALERNDEPQGVPAGRPFAAALAVLVALAVLSGRRSAGAWIAAVGLGAAGVAHALLVIPLQSTDRGYLDLQVQVGHSYVYVLRANGGALVSGPVHVTFDGSDQGPCPTSTPTPPATLTPTPSSTATPTPTFPTPTPTATFATSWLGYVNRFRALANVPALDENSTWSAGGRLHSRYMVKNDFIGHDEDTSNPWYTPEGRTAAQNGNVMVSSSPSVPDEYAVDLWMTGPFHAVGVIDPQLHTTGFGSYREADGGWAMGGTLDVLRGTGGVPAGTSFPLPFPKSGGQTWLLSYGGSEAPDPLTSCSGYSAPSGPPVILQLGSGGVTPNVTAHAFSEQGGAALEHCVFDETNYVNSNSSYQSLGRAVLGARDAVVLMPKKPLAVGKTYHVSITSNGNTTSWSFSTVAPPPSSRTAAATGSFRVE